MNDSAYYLEAFDGMITRRNDVIMMLILNKKGLHNALVDLFSFPISSQFSISSHFQFYFNFNFHTDGIDTGLDT